LYSTNVEAIRLDFKRGEVIISTDNYSIRRNVLNLCNPKTMDPPIDFVGRHELLSKLRSNRGFIYVWGPPGIGKTSLVSKAFEGEEVIWHMAREWEGLTTLAKKLACFLVSKGYHEVLDYIIGLEIEPESFANVISKHMSIENNVTIVIDDYHRASQKLADFVEHLYASGFSARLVAISRRRPVGLWKRALVVKVPPLSKEETKQFTRIHKLDFREAWIHTRGHPGFLRLYSEIPSSYRERAIDYITSDVLNELSELEVNILILLATLPDPIDKTLLSRIFGRRIDRYLYNLRKLGLIVELDRAVTVPDFLKGILANPENVKDVILNLINKLMNGGWEDKLRAMRYSLVINYNLMAAKIAKWRLTSNDYTYLYYLDSYGELIKAARLDGLDPLHLAYLLIEKSNIERQQGDYKKAVELSSDASKVCEAIGDDTCIADALALYGYLKAFTGDAYVSLEILNKALHHAEKSKNPVSLYSVYSNLALAYSMIKDYNTCYEYIKKEKEMARRLNDIHTLLVADFHEAHVLLFLNKLKEAEELLAYVSRVAEQIRLMPVKCLADSLRAEICIRTGRIDEAVKVAESAYEIGKKLGRHYASFAADALGKALLLTGDIEGVIEICRVLPNTPSSILLCSLALAKKGEKPEALTRLKELCNIENTVLEGVIDEFYIMQDEIIELLEQSGCSLSHTGIEGAGETS
ncbi:MAG: hypothetical protein F7C82_05765, partial [Desulfurococcales archaeon]|nr:hypothetical protein [Desulfurococcales archaeon]